MAKPKTKRASLNRSISMVRRNFAWREPVRPFISSTFVDFEEERDHLVRRIFPQLNSLCHSRGTYFAPVDLRWGINEEQSQSGHVISLCLDYINQCTPFFICLLGERYGSHRPSEASQLSASASYRDLPDDAPWLDVNFLRAAASGHNWVLQDAYQRSSITELEIIQAAFLNDSRYCRFYFRDARHIEDRFTDLPKSEREEKLKPYLAEDEESELRVTDLKRRIVARGLPVNFYFTAEELGMKVLNDWLAIINEVYPPLQSFLSNVDSELFREWAAHEAYAETRRRVFIQTEGIKTLYEELHQHGEAAMEEESTEKETNYASKASERSASSKPIFTLVGDRGCGKSAIMANWVKSFQKQNPGTKVISHFVGSSSLSADIASFLRRATYELRGEFTGIDTKNDGDTEDLSDFHRICEAFVAAVGLGPSVIVLDGIDELGPTLGLDIYQVKQLPWLPVRFPKQCKLVISTVRSDLTYKCLSERDDTTIFTVPPFDSSQDKSKVIMDMLAVHCKHLDQSQINKVVGSKLSNRPLYLSILANELRVGGTYRNLGRLLDQYVTADSFRDLWRCVIDRWTKDYGWSTDGRSSVSSNSQIDDLSGWVADMLKLIACSRQGLSEAELQEILSMMGYSGQSQVTTFDFAMLRSATFDALFEKPGGLMNFFHQHLREAVEFFLLGVIGGTNVDTPSSSAINFLPRSGQNQLKRKYHEILADYFWKQPSSLRRTEELTYQLEKCGNMQRLGQVVTDPDVFLMMCGDGSRRIAQRLDLLRYWQFLVKNGHDPAVAYVDMVKEVAGKEVQEGEEEQKFSLAKDTVDGPLPLPSIQSSSTIQGTKDLKKLNNTVSNQLSVIEERDDRSNKDQSSKQYNGNKKENTGIVTELMTKTSASIMESPMEAVPVSGVTELVTKTSAPITEGAREAVTEVVTKTSTPITGSARKAVPISGVTELVTKTSEPISEGARKTVTEVVTKTPTPITGSAREAVTELVTKTSAPISEGARKTVTELVTKTSAPITGSAREAVTELVTKTSAPISEGARKTVTELVTKASAPITGSAREAVTELVTKTSAPISEGARKTVTELVTKTSAPISEGARKTVTELVTKTSAPITGSSKETVLASGNTDEEESEEFFDALGGESDEESYCEYEPGERCKLALLGMHAGKFLSDKACFKEAESLLTLAVEDMGKKFPLSTPEQILLVQIQESLADLQYYQLEMVKALKFYRKALDTLGNIAVGETDPMYQTLMETKGRLLNQVGIMRVRDRLQRKGERILMEARDCMRRANSIAGLATTQFHLGHLKVCKREFEDGENCLREALQTRERWNGKSHPLVAEVLDELAGVLCNPNNINRRDNIVAEALYRRALKIREQSFGGDHLLVATTLFHLGKLLKLSGNHQCKVEAVGLLKRAMDIRTAKLGSGHTLTYAVRQALKKVQTQLKVGDYYHAPLKQPDKRTKDNPNSALTWHDQDLVKFEKRSRTRSAKSAKLGRDNRTFGRDNRTFGRDNRTFERDNRTFGRDNRTFGRDNRTFERDNRTFGRDNRTFGRDNRTIQRDAEFGRGQYGRETSNASLSPLLPASDDLLRPRAQSAPILLDHADAALEVGCQMQRNVHVSRSIPSGMQSEVHVVQDSNESGASLGRTRSRSAKYSRDVESRSDLDLNWRKTVSRSASTQSSGYQQLGELSPSRGFSRRGRGRGRGRCESDSRVSYATHRGQCNIPGQFDLHPSNAKTVRGPHSQVHHLLGNPPCPRDAGSKIVHKAAWYHEPNRYPKNAYDEYPPRRHQVRPGNQWRNQPGNRMPPQPDDFYAKWGEKQK